MDEGIQGIAFDQPYRFSCLFGIVSGYKKDQKQT